MRRAMVVAALVALAGCSAPSPSTTVDRYPLPPAGPPGTSQLNPAALDEPIRAVVLYLQPRPGDRITVLGAEPIGELDGADVTFLLSRPAPHDDGTTVIGESFEPYEGQSIAAPSGTQSPDHTVGLVAEMTPGEPGTYALTSVRLRYSINDGPEQVGEGIHVTWTVCADDPKPEDCPVPVTR